MGFFSSLKNATKESVKALGHGAEILSEAAESFERATDIWATESQINLLERTIDREISGEFCRYDIDEKLDEQDELFQKFAKKADASDVARVGERREQLIARVNEATAEVSIAEIKEDMAALQHRSFARPVDHKRELERLTFKIKALLEILPASKQPLIQEFQQQQKQLLANIHCLEAQRDTEEFDYYSNGSKKSVLRRRDGVLNGDSEEWYENGERKQIARFSEGRSEGDFTCWRDDGSLLVQTTRSTTGEQTQTLYLKGGVVIGDIRVKRTGGGQAKLWLWNGVYVGKAAIVEGRVVRSGFIFRALFRPLVWISLLKAWKVEADQDGLMQMNATAEAWARSLKALDEMH